MAGAESWMASAALRLLWGNPSLPGRWRLQRWAERHAGAYAQHAPRTIRMQGFDFAVEPQASFDVFLNGISRNTPVEKIIRDHVKPGDTVLDIGASIGWTARLMAALVGPAGSVHAFEPIPAAFRNLRRNAEAAPNIHTHALAVSDADGEIKLYLAADDQTALASMRAPGDGAAAHVHRVRTVVLDRFEPPLPRVAFAKIDVEGAEHKVVAGMEQIIRRWQPTLAIELSDAWLRGLGSSGQALLDHLHARGYEVLACDGHRYTPVTTAPPQQIDIVCVPKEPRTAR